MNTPQGVAILGATGSIGMSTLDVIRRNPARYRVVALTAHRDVERMARLCRQYDPLYAVMADPAAAEQLQNALHDTAGQVRVLGGAQALCDVVALAEVDTVMAAIVGAAGLLPTLEAARRGKRILLANKEALVMSGALFMQEIQQGGALLLPVDSEHNALFQGMPAKYVPGSGRPAGVTKIMLTASGGPFRNTPPDQLSNITPEQACAHPNWAMGRKISVDSATMMNKGLEVIEACWLYTLPANDVQVVIHPQSVVHSMVQYQDGSVLAQLGNPDMRTPIAHCLGWPQRIDAGVEALDMLAIGRLEFEAPDPQRFPCLRLAQDACRAGGTSAAILNAANEIAVQAFLEGQLGFTDIPAVIETVLEKLTPGDAGSIEAILADDTRARDYALQLVERQPARRHFS